MKQRMPKAQVSIYPAGQICLADAEKEQTVFGNSTNVCGGERGVKCETKVINWLTGLEEEKTCGEKALGFYRIELRWWQGFLGEMPKTQTRGERSKADR